MQIRTISQAHLVLKELHRRSDPPQEHKEDEPKDE